MFFQLDISALSASAEVISLGNAPSLAKDGFATTNGKFILGRLRTIFIIIKSTNLLLLLYYT
jgi:hypothetical protein